MNRNLRTRSIIITVITALCLIIMFGPWHRTGKSAGDFFKPSKLKENLAENIKLGLDLRGGTHLVMQVQADDAIKAITDGNVLKTDSELKKANIPFTAVETPDASKHSEIRDKMLPYFGGESEWSVSTSTSPASVTFSLNSGAANRIRREATDQAKTIIEQRINQFGVTEPTVQLHGREEDHQILVQMPGIDDPERVKKLIQGQSKLEIRAVSGYGQKPYATRAEAEATLAGATDKEVLPYNEKRGDGRADTGFYVVEKVPVITGADLRNARGIQSQQGFGYEVGFDLKPTGSEKFGTWTGNNVGNYLAVVLNDEIKSVAVVKSRIDESGRIEGNFTRQQAEDLGLVLRSGALPAKIVYLEERTVGPSLGADSIRQGMVSLVAGLGLVILFMLFYYRFSGLNAVIALALNLVILLAGLAAFGAT